jgi:hypothetical protein
LICERLARTLLQICLKQGVVLARHLARCFFNVAQWRAFAGDDAGISACCFARMGRRRASPWIACDETSR